MSLSCAVSDILLVISQNLRRTGDPEDTPLGVIYACAGSWYSYGNNYFVILSRPSTDLYWSSEHHGQPCCQQMCL